MSATLQFDSTDLAQFTVSPEEGPFLPGEQVTITLAYRASDELQEQVGEADLHVVWAEAYASWIEEEAESTTDEAGNTVRVFTWDTAAVEPGEHRLELSLTTDDDDDDDSDHVVARATVRLTVELGRALVALSRTRVSAGEAVDCIVEGYATPRGEIRLLSGGSKVEWSVRGDGAVVPDDATAARLVTTGLHEGEHRVEARVLETYRGRGRGRPNRQRLIATGEARVRVADDVVARGSSEDPFTVQLDRTAVPRTHDEILWLTIDDRTNALGWASFGRYLDDILCGTDGDGDGRRTFDYSTRLDAYRFLRQATDEYLRSQCGIYPPPGADAQRWVTGMSPDEVARLRDDYLEKMDGSNGDLRVLPYLGIIRRGLASVPIKPAATLGGDSCYGLSAEALSRPCMIELLWSYWMEQGMLVQTVAAIANRFQNRAGQRVPDPLASFALDPLRSASNLLWGYLQTEHERLSVARRAFEYLAHYGLTLDGRAVPKFRPAETRSRFLEAFHTLLHVTSRFFREDDDNTVSADAFPILNALHDLHLVLAEGAHNQYGDLPWTARVEMLTEQWILSRPEVREFLRSRPMVPLAEPWMGTVEVMRSLQGWGDTSITHFRQLAVSGEKLLLSVRFGGWSDVDKAASAAVWARHWRSRIQSYVHSYRAVTGVDLTLDQTATRLSQDLFEQPSVHLKRRLTPAKAGR
jgi:hypothetical protein